MTERLITSIIYVFLLSSFCPPFVHCSSETQAFDNATLIELTGKRLDVSDKFQDLEGAIQSTKKDLQAPLGPKTENPAQEDDHGKEDKDKVPIVSGSQPPASSIPSPKLPEEITEVPVNPSETQIEFEEDRHNFALAKDGAKVIAANKEAKKAGALLDSDGDTYLKNECKADKWVIVELSQLIKLDTIAFSQNELYSSRIREFEVKGRQSHPRLEGTDYSKTLNTSSWQFLGKFNATNTKGSQVFKLESPVWLKYLQLRMLSHHGTEAVCALNDLCVYGKSAAEDLEDRLSSDQELEEESKPVPILPIPAVPASLQEPFLDNGSQAEDQLSKTENQTTEPTKTETTQNEKVEKTSQGEEKSGKKSLENLDDGKSLKDLLEKKQDIKVASLQQLEKDQPVQMNQTQSQNAALIKPTLDLLTDSNTSVQDNTQKGSIPVQNIEKKGDSLDPGPADHENIVQVPKPVVPNGETELPVNSASSSASRHGGSMYDKLVQELKSTKLAQKNISRILDELRHNITAVLGSFALDIDLLSMRLDILHPPLPAILPSNQNEDFCEANSLNSNNSTCRANFSTDSGPLSKSHEVVLPPSDIEAIQAEIADLRQLIISQNQRLQKLVVMPLFVLCGFLGFSLIYLVCYIPPSRTSFGMMTLGCCIVGWLLRTYSHDLMLQD